MIDVEHWAEIRRLHFVVGLSIKEICRRTGRNRSTVRRAVRSERPPTYRRPPVASKLEPHMNDSARALSKATPRIGAIWSPPIDQQTYDEVKERFWQAGVDAGLRFHAAGESSAGWRVIEV